MLYQLSYASPFHCRKPTGNPETTPHHAQTHSYSGHTAAQKSRLAHPLLCSKPRGLPIRAISAHTPSPATSLPSLIYLDRTREEGKPVSSPISLRRMTYDTQEIPFDYGNSAGLRCRRCPTPLQCPERRTAPTPHSRANLNTENGRWHG